MAGPASDSVLAALKDAERVAKKQKTCAAMTAEALDRVIAEVRTAHARLLAGRGDGAKAAQDLNARLQKMDVVAQVSNQTKEVHSAVNKLGKSVEKAFVADVCAATRDVKLDEGTLNGVIAQHLFHTGRFRVGELFVQEAGVAGGEALKEPFTELHEILMQVHARNLAPALAWAGANRERLRARDARGAEAFEFQLHRLQFLHTLQQQGARTPPAPLPCFTALRLGCAVLSRQCAVAALGYARAHFTRFQASALADIRRLMGCLCWVRRPGASPYADLMAPAHWDAAAREFARQCCGLLGQSCESALLVAVAAGSVALPTLLKMAAVLTAQGQDFRSGEQLPMELELGREFVFHSVFACPVSREQSTPENPPMLLPCGHALAKQSLLKIAKNSGRPFKCPYCPMEATPGVCRHIFFPDAP